LQLTMSKLQEKSLTLKREHPALQKINFVNFFLCLWFIFALLDPDTDPGTPLNPDPQHCLKRVSAVHGRARVAKTHWYFIFDQLYFFRSLNGGNWWGESGTPGHLSFSSTGKSWKINQSLSRQDFWRVRSYRRGATIAGRFGNFDLTLRHLLIFYDQTEKFLKYAQESILPTYVAWRAGTTAIFLPGSLPPIDGSKIQAQAT
jgi:hypothetical protein